MPVGVLAGIRDQGSYCQAQWTFIWGGLRKLKQLCGTIAPVRKRLFVTRATIMYYSPEDL
jgi:hypothetical protein